MGSLNLWSTGQSIIYTYKLEAGNMAREMKAQADAAADEWRQEAAAAVEAEEENEEEGEEEAEEGRRAAWSSFGNAVDEEEECAAIEGRIHATN